MIVAFGAQVIANFHDNSQALQDTERALRVSPIHIRGVQRCPQICAPTSWVDCAEI